MKRWVLFILITLAAFFGLLCLFGPAKAHDWYTGTQNQQRTSCCGGYDCGPVALDEVTETATEFIFTPNHARNYLIVGKQYHFAKATHAQPTKKWDPSDPTDTGYHACVSAGQTPLCFFYPTGA